MHEHAITLFIMNKRTLELTRLHSGPVGVTGAHILTSRRGLSVLHLLSQNLAVELMQGFFPICDQKTQKRLSYFPAEALWGSLKVTNLMYLLKQSARVHGELLQVGSIYLFTTIVGS